MAIVIRYKKCFLHEKEFGIIRTFRLKEMAVREC